MARKGARMQAAAAGMAPLVAQATPAAKPIATPKAWYLRQFLSTFSRMSV